MTANCEKSDICNVQGDDAECVLDELNAQYMRFKMRARDQSPRILSQELNALIDVFLMVLKDSGHQVELTPNGYVFHRGDTGSFPAIQLPHVS